MKCNCCDREISDKEIIWNEELGAWEMCTTCLDAAFDAAYTNGFLTEDDEFVLIDDETYDNVIALEGWGGRGVSHDD